jgi:hypothetical protein
MGYFLNLQKNLPKENNRPIIENSANLVTLPEPYVKKIV